MPYNVDYTSLVYVWGRMGLVADDDRLLLMVNELPTGACVLQHLVAHMFEQRLEFVPLEIGGWWYRAEPLKSLLVLGH